MTASATPPVLTPGALLEDKYRIERVLGAGGMGMVVAATHVRLDELVAIKVMLPDMAQDANAVARFLREARAAVRIRSEHVARVLDVATLSDGTPYMVMEYLHGTDLSGLIQERGAVDVEMAVLWVLEASDAIAEAHSLGIVHRDLKPANLFLTNRSDGSTAIKVLDFGISKVATLSGDEASLTATHACMGSPLYMSPEQMQSAKTVDRRADIWALGCVLFELVTGRPPFNAETLPELCGAIMTSPVVPPSSLRANVPKAFDTIVERCLAKSPDDRYANLGELATALQPLQPELRALVERICRRTNGSASASIRPSVAPSTAGKVPGLATASAWATSWRNAKRWGVSPWMLAGTAGIAGALGVVAWLAMIRGSSAGRNVSAAAGIAGSTLAAPSRSAAAPAPAFPPPEPSLQSGNPELGDSAPLSAPTRAAHAPAPEKTLSVASAASIMGSKNPAPTTNTNSPRTITNPSSPTSATPPHRVLDIGIK
jgi:eukaryotic-like serine/threonine-protein kinase